MRKLFWFLLTASAWADEPSMQQDILLGFKWAVILVVGVIGGMWLLFAFVQKFGGMGGAQWGPHKVEDIGPIDRQKSNAFAAREREAMRQPYVDNYQYPQAESYDFGS
ncbi:MAG: hypothetical protein KF760_04500 [Candidatus Eremiobacteraeota bacterium]|nr:hypothetical protein [Candidatus Eremiobacteraeota bacterium]MCW5866933.1 hypothetical protein [Candidatus Eremiobacteraeota bacterium]